MKHCIEIVLTDEEGNIKAPLEEYTLQVSSGNWPAELPDPEYAGYRWHTGEQNEMTETIYPGQLNLLVLQFEEAANRLQQNLPAVLHFGEYGGEGGSYILLYPEEGQVTASVFFVGDSKTDGTLPIENAIGDPANLYRYVSEHTDELMQAEKNEEMYFKQVHFSAVELKAALEAEAAAGRELYRLCKKEITPTFIT